MNEHHVESVHASSASSSSSVEDAKLDERPSDGGLLSKRDTKEGAGREVISVSSTYDIDDDGDEHKRNIGQLSLERGGTSSHDRYIEHHHYRQ